MNKCVVYNEKLIVSGKFIEVYKYSKSQVCGYQKEEELKKEKEKREAENRSTYSLSRSRNNIKRLIYANDDLNKFLTLTFAKNQIDLKEANYEFKKFIKKVKYINQDLKYLTIVEFQKRGAVHYHNLSNMSFLKSKEIEKLWGNGFIKINRIQSQMYDSIAPYVAKYLQKQKVDSRLIEKKAYFHSRNLNYPQVIHNNAVVQSLKEMYNLNYRKPKYQKSFTNDYAGDVDYKIYKI